MKKNVFYLIFSFFFIPFMVYGQTDLFQVKTPNVMIIFDTSSSMEMSVNINSQGNSIWSTQYGPDGIHQYRQDGNHPDSKLYQAKNALSQVISQVVQNKVNLGFATYAQEKINQMRGEYTRTLTVVLQYASPAEWRLYKRYYLWGTTNDGTRTATSIYSNSFIDAWGFTRTPVGVGSTFTRAIYIHNKSGPLHPQVCSSGANCIGGFLATSTYTITYQVTAVTLNPETNVYTFTYSPTSPAYDYYWEGFFYGSWSLTSLSCGSDTMGNPWPKNEGSWSTHFSDDSPPTEYNNPSNGRTAGWWNCYVQYQPAQSEIDQVQTQYWWANTPGTSCAATQAGTPVWNLMSGTCFDWSGYEYTPQGTTNMPNIWSYFQKDSKGNWPKNEEPSPYYPAPSGNPGQNDNHYFFVNFPDDKATGFNDSVRTTIENTILSFLDLTPVMRPDWSEYWTKLPVQAIQGRQGLTANMDPINPFAFNPQHVTPLADSLSYAYTYFYDYIYNYNGGDPSSQEQFGDTLCRGNYIILLTDGLESCELDSNGNPIYTAAPQQAANLLAIKVKTFVIGFGADVKGDQTINNIASSGGTGQAYFASNFNQLKTALQSIFQSITGEYYGRSNPVIARDRSRLYRGSFDIENGDWLGHLQAWDANPQTGVLAPNFAWDAGDEITINGRGPVYTWTATGLEPAITAFTANQSSLYSLVNPLNEDINNDGVVNNLDAIAVIKFTLEADYNDCDDNVVDKVTKTCHGPGYYQGQRAINVSINGTIYPSWKLGDVYHSTPVVIGAPAFSFTDNNYATFYNNNQNREVIIYVGTNDGMLHAIRDTDGTEKFSIIPQDLLGRLKDLRLTHEFYVDSSPKAYDVYFNSESKWKSVLISGERGGGNYYFAIDVTDPNNPLILWDWTDPNMGQTWAKPDIGRVKVGSNTKSVAFFTGGYSTTANQGNSFYIVDIETGTTLKMWTQSNGNPVGSSTNTIPAGPTAYDVNQDGFIEYVYFGDISGTLWKVDVSDTNINNWTLYNFFTPQNPMPIFYSPAVANNNQGQTLIFFGTGNELGLTTLDTNYFYEIQDQGATGTLVWSQTLGSGEKVLDSPSVSNYVVYFTTWVYTSSSEYCGAGEGRLWGLNISSTTDKGGEAGLVTLNAGTGQWTSPQEYISLGVGIPSAPIVTNGMVYVSNSLNANKVIQVPIPAWNVSQIKSWREVVQ